MVLKESFRMQNYLGELSHQALVFLSHQENVMSIREEHLKNRRNPNAADEFLEIKRETDMVPDKVVELYLDILAEREKLALAINKAKTAAEIDIDAAISINKMKQEAISRFKVLAGIKSSEKTKNGEDYLINTEGNQTPYIYTIRSISTIDFNRDTVKGIIRRLQRECDEMSTKIDVLNVTLDVSYEPKYEIGESFEDIYEEFVNWA